MKQLLLVGLAALALAVPFGCSQGKEAPTGDKPLKVGIVYDKGGLGDKSFNDSAARGIEKAKVELGIEVVQIESMEVGDYESNLREVADKGCDLVFAIGFNMEKGCDTVAKEFPGVKFAIVDGTVEQPNTRSLHFKEEEGSYLVGYLAGLMTKTNKIGFVGGQVSDLIKKFEYGYLAGATAANPRVVMLPSKYTGDWDNIDVGKANASVLYGSGADIVYHAAGRAGLGVLREAAQRKKYAIGVDSDQDGVEPGFVLTSMIKRVDFAVFETISDLANDKFTAGAVTHDLASGGIGYSDLTYTREAIGEENIAKLEAVKQQIIDGAIKVPTTQEEWEAMKPAGT
jgi:basic membrane protein A